VYESPGVSWQTQNRHFSFKLNGQTILTNPSLSLANCLNICKSCINRLEICPVCPTKAMSNRFNACKSELITGFFIFFNQYPRHKFYITCIHTSIPQHNRLLYVPFVLFPPQMPVGMLYLVPFPNKLFARRGICLGPQFIEHRHPI
jgi:hypothetical protein